MPSDPEPRRLALITGASAGIGAAFARVYAGHGYDLAITARRGDRLQQLADDIKLRHAVEILTIPADLADPAAPEHILAEVARRGRTVQALVNNAGYGLKGGFAAAGWPEQAAMLQVMLTAVCEMTHRVLPGMVGGGFGRIVNVASLAGLLPGSPGQSLYTPIKAFLIRFSNTLHVETHGSGVHVTALCPGFTCSEFHDANGSRAEIHRCTPRWMWRSAEAAAAAGYGACEANRPICIPGAPNRVIAAMARLIPDTWLLAAMARRWPPSPRGGRIGEGGRSRRS